MMNDLLMNVMMLDFAVQDAALFIDTLLMMKKQCAIFMKLVLVK